MGYLKLKKIIIDPQDILNHPQGSDQVHKGHISSQQLGSDIPLIINRMLLVGES